VSRQSNGCCRVAEKDQVLGTQIFGGDIGVVLQRQVAAVVVLPFVGETPQAGVGPIANGRVPGLARAADAKKRRGKGVVDGALQARSFAGEVTSFALPALCRRPCVARSPASAARPILAGARRSVPAHRQRRAAGQIGQRQDRETGDILWFGHVIEPSFASRASISARA